jgi:hypothetical protein
MSVECCKLRSPAEVSSLDSSQFCGVESGCVCVASAMNRGDLIPIDPRSHLEVADKKHRYAKNLRAYFKEYHRRHGSTDLAEAHAPSSSGAGSPSRKWARYDPFFRWLDNEDELPEVRFSTSAIFRPLGRCNSYSCAHNASATARGVPTKNTR